MIDYLAIGGTRDEFWDLTFRQLQQEFIADSKRFDKYGILGGKFTADLINAWIDKNVKPSDVFQPQYQQLSPQPDEEQLQENFEKTVAVMGTEAIPVDRD